MELDHHEFILAAALAEFRVFAHKGAAQILFRAAADTDIAFFAKFGYR